MQLKSPKWKTLPDNRSPFPTNRLCRREICQRQIREDVLQAVGVELIHASSRRQYFLRIRQTDVNVFRIIFINAFNFAVRKRLAQTFYHRRDAEEITTLLPRWYQRGQASRRVDKLLDMTTILDPNGDKALDLLSEERIPDSFSDFIFVQ